MTLRQRRSTLVFSLSFPAMIALSCFCLPEPVFGQGTGQQRPIGSQAALPGPSGDLLRQLEGVYKDIHANPELSMQERRTAGIAAKWLRYTIEFVREGLQLAFIVTYAQGLELLRAASTEKKYEVDLVEISKIWRGGCIIRAALLEDIRKAFESEPGLEQRQDRKRIPDRTGRGDARQVSRASS